MVDVGWVIPGLLAFAIGAVVIVLVAVYAKRTDDHIADDIVCTKCPDCPVLVDDIADDLDLFRANSTLFVSPVWPSTWAGHLVPTYFTNITDALTQAIALNPSSKNAVLIVLFPGTYAENLTMPSYVTLVGSDDASVITGDLTWTPGYGINAKLPTGVQTLNLYHLTVHSLVMDMTNAVNSSFHGAFYASDCTFTGDITLSYMPSPPTDNAVLNDCTVKGSLTMTNGTRLTATGSVLEGTATLTGSALGGIQSVSLGIPSFVLSNDSSAVLYMWEVSGTITLSFASTLYGRGCYFQDTITLDSTSTGDILGCKWAALAGTGGIDRSLTTLTASPSSNGANQLDIAPPFKTNLYSAAFTQTAPTSSVQIPIITSQTVSAVNYDVQNATSVTYTVVLFAE